MAGKELCEVEVDIAMPSVHPLIDGRDEAMRPPPFDWLVQPCLRSKGCLSSLSSGFWVDLVMVHIKTFYGQEVDQRHGCHNECRIYRNNMQMQP